MACYCVGIFMTSKKMEPNQNRTFRKAKGYKRKQNILDLLFFVVTSLLLGRSLVSNRAYCYWTSLYHYGKCRNRSKFREKRTVECSNEERLELGELVEKYNEEFNADVAKSKTRWDPKRHCEAALGTSFSCSSWILCESPKRKTRWSRAGKSNKVR